MSKTTAVLGLMIVFTIFWYCIVISSIYTCIKNPTPSGDWYDYPFCGVPIGIKGLYLLVTLVSVILFAVKEARDKKEATIPLKELEAYQKQTKNIYILAWIFGIPLLLTMLAMFVMAIIAVSS